MSTKIKIKSINDKLILEGVLNYYDNTYNSLNNQNHQFDAIKIIKLLKNIPLIEFNSNIENCFKNNVQKNLITKEYFISNFDFKYQDKIFKNIEIVNKTFLTKKGMIDFLEKIFINLIIKEIVNGCWNISC